MDIDELRQLLEIRRLQRRAELVRRYRDFYLAGESDDEGYVSSNEGEQQIEDDLIEL